MMLGEDYRSSAFQLCSRVNILTQTVEDLNEQYTDAAAQLGNLKQTNSGLNSDYETAQLYCEELAILLQRRNLTISDLQARGKEADAKIARLHSDLNACQTEVAVLKDEMANK